MSGLPQDFRLIRLELAREKGHPEGSRETGYEIVAPLDADQKIDLDLWKAHRANCRVRRFHEGEDAQVGRLARRRNGNWFFDYDDQSDDDDEAAYRLGEERFVPGEYVSIADGEGEMHTYKVVTVRPL